MAVDGNSSCSIDVATLKATAVSREANNVELIGKAAAAKKAIKAIM
jgi:hypothetical protein